MLQICVSLHLPTPYVQQSPLHLSPGLQDPTNVLARDPHPTPIYPKHGLFNRRDKFPETVLTLPRSTYTHTYLAHSHKPQSWRGLGVTKTSYHIAQVETLRPGKGRQSQGQDPGLPLQVQGSFQNSCLCLPGAPQCAISNAMGEEARLPLGSSPSPRKHSWETARRCFESTHMWTTQCWPPERGWHVPRGWPSR